MAPNTGRTTGTQVEPFVFIELIEQMERICGSSPLGGRGEKEGVAGVKRGRRT